MITMAAHRYVPVLVAGDGEEQPLSLRGGGEHSEEGSVRGTNSVEEGVTGPSAEGMNLSTKSIAGEGSGRVPVDRAAAEGVPADTSAVETANKDSMQSDEAPPLLPTAALNGAVELEPPLLSNNKPWEDAVVSVATKCSEGSRGAPQPLPPAVTTTAAGGETAENAHKAASLAEGQVMTIDSPPAATVTKASDSNAKDDAKDDAATTFQESKGSTAASDAIGDTMAPTSGVVSAPSLSNVTSDNRCSHKVAVTEKVSTATSDLQIAPSSRVLVS